ncbi:MAG TPA: hypothetical protein ENJ40_08490 [Thermosulfurimonas dismutans]|uniref:Uncharacterized protein n=1 Tax=Thermosulfurimonas dismutans TaxID=999894 RepID=A0A7C3CL98_9BACT|nr:hypothetical protein [Thermosulfurimonas dismutans]
MRKKDPWLRLHLKVWGLSGVVALVLYAAIFLIPWGTPLFRVGCGAWMVFVIALAFFHLYSGEHREYSPHTTFEKAQVRRAILVSFLFIFFALLGIGDEIRLTPDTLLARLLSHFDLYLLVILGFYFGGKALREGIRAWRESSRTP